MAEGLGTARGRPDRTGAPRQVVAVVLRTEETEIPILGTVSEENLPAAVPDSVDDVLLRPPGRHDHVTDVRCKLLFAPLSVDK